MQINWIRKKNIKTPLSYEMLLYYLSLGYTCFVKYHIGHDVCYSFIRTDWPEDPRKEYFSKSYIEVPTIRDIKKLITYGNCIVPFTIFTNIDLVEMMINNYENLHL